MLHSTGGVLVDFGHKEGERSSDKEGDIFGKGQEKKVALQAHDHWCRAVIPCNSFLFCDALFSCFQ
jgi:hypothetical protein